VSGLTWSVDAEMLAVTVEQEDRRLLQLWQRRNWHWYLKKQRRFALNQVCCNAATHVSTGRVNSVAHRPCACYKGALHVHWDETSPGVLRVFTAGGSFTQASA
jgi:hypothetical protein